MAPADARATTPYYGDKRHCCIQALTNQKELPRLLTFLRAVCHDASVSESWVSIETVYTSVVDRRQRSAKVLQEYVEKVKSSTESPGFHLPLEVATTKGKRVLIYEERDIRSSADILVRRRVTTPVDESMEKFLSFQSCLKKHQIARRGLRFQFMDFVMVTLFIVEQSGCPMDSEDILVEIESLVKEGGSVLESIEAVREAAAVLHELSIRRVQAVIDQKGQLRVDPGYSRRRSSTSLHPSSSRIVPI